MFSAKCPETSECQEIYPKDYNRTRQVIDTHVGTTPYPIVLILLLGCNKSATLHWILLRSLNCVPKVSLLSK